MSTLGLEGREKRATAGVRSRRAVLRGRALCGARRVRRSRNAPRRQTRRVLGPVGCRLRCSRRGARGRVRVHMAGRDCLHATAPSVRGLRPRQVGRRRGGRSRTRVAPRGGRAALAGGLAS